MDDQQQAAPKKRGRPKRDPNAPKATYNLSTKERARRAATKRVNAAKKRAEKSTKAAEDRRRYARKLEQQTTKVEKALVGNGSATIDLGDLDVLPDAVSDLVAESEVVFQPNSGPQTDFLSAGERDVLYGGAAGGGKSFALLADPLRYCHNPNHRGLLLRRTLDELTELIDKSRQLYPKAFPGAKFRESKSTWHFPSGATIWFTYLDKDKDVTRFQGQAFNWIGIDEITQYPTPYVWDYLRSRLRTTDSELQQHLYMRCTANPGGVGGWWVKKTYIEDVEPNKPFPAFDIETKVPFCGLTDTKRQVSRCSFVNLSRHG